MVNFGFIYSQQIGWHIKKCWYVWLKVVTSLFSYFSETLLGFMVFWV